MAVAGATASTLSIGASGAANLNGIEEAASRLIFSR